MSKRYSKKVGRKDDVRKQIIQRQINEIEKLKTMISDLRLDCDKKDEIVDSIDTIRDDFIEVVDELRTKKNEYEKLISELIEMRNTMNEVVFKRRWRLIRWLMR